MANRESFLGRIRQRSQHHVPFPGPDPGPSVAKSVLSGAEPLSDLITHFTAMLEDVGGYVERVATAADAREWFVAFARERAAACVVMDRDVVVPDLADALWSAGVEVVLAPVGEQDREGAAPAFRQACATADLGITGAAYAVADTGTVVALAGPGRPRSTSLLPPVHVAAVRAAQFVPHLSALLERLRADEWRHGLPSAMALITGPSRTADIEQTLSVGVHGPREAYVVIIDEAPREGADAVA
jgi:L-lactate dehydrogenase complex protein LldG